MLFSLILSKAKCQHQFGKTPGLSGFFSELTAHKSLCSYLRWDQSFLTVLEQNSRQVKKFEPMDPFCFAILKDSMLLIKNFKSLEKITPASFHITLIVNWVAIYPYIAIIPNY